MKATREQLGDLWVRIGAKGNPHYFYDLLSNYYDNYDRHYHTLEHVGSVLQKVDNLTSYYLIGDTETAKIKWAVWFHDAWMSFDPGIDDTALSAELSTEICKKIGMSDEFIADTNRLILATSHTMEPVNRDEKILIDADLSILGTDTKTFDTYERLIRLEWKHVSDSEFKTGRSEILKRFINKPYIYNTIHADQMWGSEASRNLTRSIARLENGI